MIRTLSLEFFITLALISWLNIQGNGIPLQVDDWGTSPPLEYLSYFGVDEWRFCCLAKMVQMCDAPKKQGTSCGKMFGNFLYFSTWILAIISSLLNILVLYYRIFLKQKITGDNIFYINLAASDILMPIYLFGLATAYYTMQGVYVFQSNAWKKSLLCAILGYMASFSVMLSSLTLLGLLFFYIGVFKYPTKVADYSISTVNCLIVWIVVGVILSIPLFVHEENAFSTCLFFNITTNNLAMLLYNIFVYIVLVDVILVLSSVLCYKLIHFIFTSQKKVRSQGKVFGGVRSSRSYKKFLTIVFSVMFSWVPLEILTIISAAEVHIDTEIVNWFAILILPLNSMINPILYTFREISCGK